MSEPNDNFDSKLAKLMNDGKALLAEGKITAAHHTFAHIAKFDPAFNNVGHALAISLPNSFLVKITGQFDKDNVKIAEKKIYEIFDKYPLLKLILIDFEGVKALPHYAINLLQGLSNNKKVSIKLINLQLKPLQILKNLNFDSIIWSDKSCPICGENKKCAAKFSNRKKHEIILPDSSGL